MLILVMEFKYTTLILFILHFVTSNRKCLIEKKQYRFYKVRSCSKSNIPVISWKNFDQLHECVEFAIEKNGFAFNFSPLEAQNQTQNRWIRSCQVLGCPESTISNSLVFDPAFDYYTTFADFNVTSNATCIKAVGLFSLIEHKLNYTDSIQFCQKLGGDLADILTETRTNFLASLLKPLHNWYKAAYVGLDDIEIENRFQNPYGDLLDCTTFRAWAVGHPRPHRNKEDCVILDVDRTWRAINCKRKLPFICELLPMAPNLKEISFTYKNCSSFKTKKKKKTCLQDNEMFHLFNKSSRLDQCALLNDFE